MMIFRFRCSEHGEIEHDSRHAPTCFCGEEMERVYVMPNIAAAALPNKKAGVTAIDSQDSKLDRDRAAYKKMRAQGIQPRSVNDAHNLQNASTQFEVEYGRVFDKKDLPKIREGLDRSAEIREQAGLKGEEAWVRPKRAS